MQELVNRYNRLLHILGKDMVERLVQNDIRMTHYMEIIICQIWKLVRKNLHTENTEYENSF